MSAIITACAQRTRRPSRCSQSVIVLVHLGSSIPSTSLVYKERNIVLSLHEVRSQTSRRNSNFIVIRIREAKIRLRNALRTSRSISRGIFTRLVIYTFDMHIYTTHQLKLGMDQRREKEGVVIPSHLYIWHAHLHNSPAKVGNREKEGVVIPGHLYIWHAHLHNLPAKVGGMDQRREKRSGYS